MQQDLCWMCSKNELHALRDERLPDRLSWDAILGQLLNGTICGPGRLFNLQHRGESFVAAFKQNAAQLSNKFPG